MKIIALCENRNGVRIASELVSERPDLDWTLATTFDGTAVEAWVVSESRTRLPDHEVVDVLGDTGAIGHLETGLADVLAQRRPDVVVYFNDQSRRGRVVSRAAAGVVPRVLIQDGHLDFWFKRHGVGHGDQNARYGASDPEAICVWGPSMVRFLGQQSVERRGQIHVTGAVGVSDDPTFVSGVLDPRARVADPSRRPRLLLLDQPLADQRKMERAEYERQVLESCERIRGVADLAVKPHPSSSDRHLRWLSSVDGIELLEHSSLLGPDVMAEHDLALTFFSSTYLDAIRAGVPIVFHALDGLDIVMPDVLHPLVRNTRSIDELIDVCTHFAAERDLAANATGEPLDHFVVVGGDAEAAIVAVIESTARAGVADVPRRSSTPPTSTDPGPPVVAPRSVAILGDDFSHRTGVAVPVRAFARWLSGRTLADVFFVDLRAISSYEDLVYVLGDVETVIVNSFAPLWRLPNRVDWIRRLVRYRPVALYAHETEYVFQVEAAARGRRHREVVDLLPHVRSLCVSNAQAVMLRGLGARDCAVVWNTTPGSAVERRRRDDSAVRIVMAGTAQSRKGVDLFSRVAERAAEMGYGWEFRWVGREVVTGSETLRSDRVEWLGALPHHRVLEELADADVFFLSSFDDPQPLSVVEAIRQRLRIVTHVGVGSHEVLDGISGYESFERFDPDAALSAIESVLGSEVDDARFAEVEERFSIEEFGSRMLEALEFRYSRADWSRIEDRLAALPPGPDGVSSGSFFEAVDRGDLESAKVIGSLILRRRQATDVSLGLAAIHRREGRNDLALEMLAVTVLRDRDRGRTWLRVAEEAALLGDNSVAVVAAGAARAIARRGGRTQVAAQAGRLQRRSIGAGSRATVRRLRDGRGR
ncbi:glycosyltransferase family 4 protein [Ilumatobacter sp.]|uniref:glycosyltransferase family 4 protein n=1 Tax=Ilumatobacter sp. TaxID=1967498 RepID=UPI003B518162